ncbi:MAG: transglutaminase domain-containing protein [Lachnospiraceae bacterium]|nr:transglutaminase domain-containing protein [Lachnospiraceae bacterium]
MNSFKTRKKNILHIVLCILPFALMLSGCRKNISPAEQETTVRITEPSEETWSNKWEICMPILNEEKTEGNDYVNADFSNSSSGYFYIKYIGDSPKIKLQLFSGTSITYTYDITPNEYTVIPLSLGSGLYSIQVYENIQENEYAMVYAKELKVMLQDEQAPFLYPNQRVNYSKDSQTSILAKQLTDNCHTELEAVAEIYDYIIKNITYDYVKAEIVESGYLPDADMTLSIGTGICYDYAAVMASMLRSVGIPTRMEIGYSGDAYHAWVSVYTKDHGWIDDIIEFNGIQWTLMDPTFDANSNDKVNDFDKLLGKGNKTEYTVMYNY